VGEEVTPFEVARARAGRITSSRIAVIATGNYAHWNKLAEILRKAEPHPIGQRSGVAPLDWGHRNEPRACGEFWFRHPEFHVEHEDFRYWYDPRDKVHWELCGASPDRTLYQKARLVGVVEAKCPYNKDVHRQYWSDGVLPEEYAPQVYWQMMVTDAPCSYFISFDPRAIADRRYWELLVERSPAYETELMAKVDRFIGGYLAGEIFKPPKHNYSEIF
jgi:hypothetical protein